MLLGFKRPQETEIVRRAIEVAAPLPFWPELANTAIRGLLLDGLVSLFQHQRQLIAMPLNNALRLPAVL